MAAAIRMPKMSDTMNEGVIAEWLKKVGDTVKTGDILAEVETDKATMEMECFEDGTLLYIGVEKGKAAAVDAIVAIVGQVGEDFQDLLTPVVAAALTQKEEVSTAASSVEYHTNPLSENNDISSIAGVFAIRMPKMSDTMNEGTIHSWLKKVGDTIKAGDILAEVETDKATMEMECFEDGTLLYIGVETGGVAKVDAIVAIVGKAGADYSALLAPKQASQPQKREVSATLSSSKEATTILPSSGEDIFRMKASPLAKRLAEEKGINIAQVSGSGEGGRIIKKDIDLFVPITAPPATTPIQTSNTTIQPYMAIGIESFEDIPNSQMRKTIARRLTESTQTAPHFYLTMEINMDNAMKARESMNTISPVKLSFNDIVIKAVAATLRLHPKVNASWTADAIRMYNHIHIGMAVAVNDGLVVPVIRFADSLTLSQLSTAAKDLGGRAKERKLKIEEMQGNTFTVSNLGMFGIDEFTSIINTPEACILSVGAIKQVPIVKDGVFAIGNLMKVTMACDHRVVDGAVGAAFLQTFRNLIEDPIRLLV